VRGPARLLEVARERRSGALVLRRGAGVAETRGQLTAREVRSRDSLATAGRKPEIGARLFISPRTRRVTTYNKVFTKLDISSRNQLDQALPSEEREALPV
jgi:hypothetical protein